MEFILNLAIQSIQQVGLTLLNNWPFLVVSVLIAALLKLYINAEKVSAFLTRYRSAGVVAATAAAVATPLCSCGTTAIILGMMASSMPWAPIVAFMVSSPLTSPEGLVYSAGLFGWPFAWAFYLASIILGLGGGYLAAALEKRGWLANQNRFAAKAVPAAFTSGDGSSLANGRAFGIEMESAALDAPTGCACQAAPAAPQAAACGCSAAAAPAMDCACSGAIARPAASCACSDAGQDAASLAPQATCACATAAAPSPAKQKVTLRLVLKEVFSNGERLLFMFLGFAFIGYFLNGLIPASWITSLFGGGNVYSVPLAATLGLPFYINSESSLPLIRAMLDNGMSQGAALAFLIAGSGTSIGAITGALAIARWRVVGLVVGVLWVGAILSGLAFDLLV